MTSQDVYVLPASFAQRRLWFLDQLGAADAYNIARAARLGGLLDLAAMRGAFREILRRHEVLRTHFTLVEGEPMQVIAPEAELALSLVDLSSLAEPQREAEMRSLAREEAMRPFVLDEGPLLRATLVRLADEEHVLLLTLHHIIADGWSMGLLAGELTALYCAYCLGEESPLGELPIQYADFAAWQRDRLQGDALDERLAYWRQQLDGAATLSLATDRARPQEPSFRGARCSWSLSRSLSDGLIRLGQQEGATLFMTLLAGFQALLHRHSGQDDIVVGTPVASRNRVETEELIGLFANSLALRTDFSGDPGFRQLLQRVRTLALDAFDHQDVPFEKLVEELQPERSLGLHPLYQVALALQTAPPEELALRGLEVAELERDRVTARLDLELHLWGRPEGVGGFLLYAADLFDEATIERMLGHFESLLEAVVADPDRRVSELPLLSRAERSELLAPNELASEDLPRACLHEPFEQQVERTPGATALVFGQERVSYRDLDVRANRLARRLRALGVRPGARVGIHLERSVDFVVAMLAISKAGGAFVPLDPTHPAERVRFMLEDCQARLVVTETASRAQLDEAGADLLLLDSERGPIARELEQRPEPCAGPDHLAYVLYTSGSTGTPKGVAVTHGAIAGHCAQMAGCYALTAADRVLQFASFGFDQSLEQIFTALAAGATLVLRGVEVPSLADFHRLAVEKRLSVVNVPPAYWRQWLDALGEAGRQGLPDLRLVIVGGDALQVEDVRRWRAAGLGGVRLLNAYGPTEATVTATLFEVPDELAEHSSATIPIGRPLAGRSAHVLDPRGQLLPLGVPGELHLGGRHLARGYFGQASLTARKFVPDPFDDRPGARLYRTGDRARRLPDGTIEFLGRIDQQVKVRGFRVEPGEIEAALEAHADVAAAVVAARPDASDNLRLVGWVVPREGARFDGSALRASLQQKLPAYMVPGVMMPLDAIPLSPSGKLDRRALPAPESSEASHGEAFAAPRSPIEQGVADLFGELLEVERVGIHDHFFDLGGHSLLATLLVSRLRKRFEVEIPLGWIFQAPTVAAFAERVARARGAGAELSAPPVVAVSRGEPRDADAASGGFYEVPTSFAQRRLWFLDRLGAGDAYNVAWATRLEGVLDVPVLRACFDELVRRHEVLRTRFALCDGEAVQRIAVNPHFRLKQLDLGALDAAERRDELQRLAQEEATREFVLSDEPPFRASLVRMSERDHVLLLTLHHIAADGWSMGILTSELSALYDAYRAGASSPLPELPIQYADYAAWQRDWLRGEVLDAQLDYWRRQLDGAAVLQLATDRPRPAVQTFRGARRPWSISRRVTDALAALGAEQGATLFMTLLAAFQTLLHRYSGQDDIVVATPIASRNRVEIEGLIGFFANSLALRGDLSGDPGFRALLQRVRQVALDAYAHQDVPFEKLVEELQPERDLSRTPLFQVLFALQNAPPEELVLAGLEPAVLELDRDHVTARLDLELYLSEGPDGLHGFLVHNADLFDEATAARLLAHFTALLEGIVASPSVPISQLPLLTEDERQQLRRWNATATEQPAYACLHELFEAQLARDPAAEAIVQDDRRWTYGELERRANRLAHHLRGLGVGRDVLVGLCLERSPELVAAILGIHKAGGAYVPLDPEYPRERVSFMVADSRAPVIVTQEKLRRRLPECEGVTALCLDRDRRDIDARPEIAPEIEVCARQLSHVIYTSGSTGRPKGVAIEHRSVVALIEWATATFDDRDLAGVLASTSICFDLSLFELFAPLASGGKIVLVRDALALREASAASEVSLVNTVPSAAAELVAVGGIPESVRTVCLAGEPLHRELVDRLYRAAGVENVYDLYGPSEDTTYSTFARREPGGPETIGRPIANTRMHVLDRRGEPVPIGVPGELYIGGAGLARGYLGQPGMTAEKFVPDPFGDAAGGSGARLYRTGDRVRHRPDGSLEFLGRVDHQIKLRGFRIELGEIEVALREHPAVREAAVLARDQRLLAYVVWSAAGDASGAELRASLRDRLPEYMVPAAFVSLDALPLTPSGKLDRRALPDWEGGRPELGVDYVAPRTEAEQAIAAIWREALELGTVGVHDNFFDLGGHSLLMVAVHEKLSRAFEQKISIVDVFKYPTIELLAGFLAAGGRSDASPGRAEAIQERVDEGMSRLRRLSERRRGDS